MKLFGLSVDVYFSFFISVGIPQMSKYGYFRSQFCE